MGRRGQQSFVQLALDKLTGQQVTVKFLRRSSLDVHTVTREVVNQHACARHPHIVQLHVRSAPAAPAMAAARPPLPVTLALRLLASARMRMLSRRVRAPFTSSLSATLSLPFCRRRRCSASGLGVFMPAILIVTSSLHDGCMHPVVLPALSFLISFR